jgi:hypothetical protein
MRPFIWLSLAIAGVFALALGVASIGCGPQKRFCPDSGNGVCPEQVDASPGPSDVADAPPKEMGSIFIEAGSTE